MPSHETDYVRLIDTLSESYRLSRAVLSQSGVISEQATEALRLQRTALRQAQELEAQLHEGIGKIKFGDRVIEMHARRRRQIERAFDDDGNTAA